MYTCNVVYLNEQNGAYIFVEKYSYDEKYTF